MTADSLQIEKTIKKESGKLFNFIRKNVPTKEDAEDILQDVWYQFVSGLKRLNSWTGFQRGYFVLQRTGS